VSSEMTMSWIALLGLGAFHGINPGMGWLFAVALGMQERRRTAVWRALLPLGLGHALAVAAAILVALTVEAIVPLRYLRWPVAIILVALGVSRLIRHRHPRWASMRVGMGGLTLWSFLMASAHGAGLMVVPVYLKMAATETAHACHSSGVMQASLAPATGGILPTGVALTATALHAAGYLIVTAAIAVLVFEKFGVGLLRKAWFNLDLIWAAALIVTGLLTSVL
jgi:hypothetical protein